MEAEHTASAFATVLRTQIDLLLFRPVKPQLDRSRTLYFAWGLAVTWLAGIGRYWDHPNAATWQYLGLGSVVYVFVMALLIWMFTAPLRPRHWSYFRVLIFVMLTSAPALLYAIPVEKFMSMKGAQAANAWFLAVVAGWRFGLLMRFLNVGGGLSKGAAFVSGTLPLVLIVTALVSLNLEQAVFDIMGGFREPTSRDSSYGVLVLISAVSVVASVPLLIAWLVLVFRAWRDG